MSVVRGLYNYDVVNEAVISIQYANEYRKQSRWRVTDSDKHILRSKSKYVLVLLYRSAETSHVKRQA